MNYRFSSSVILLLTLQSSVFAQQESRSDTLLAGRRALTFSFSGFNLGGGLGGKLWLNEYYGVRVMLTGSYRNDKEDNPLIYPYAFNDNTSSTDLGINVGIVRTFLQNPPFFPYLGIAANLSETWFSEERVYQDSTASGESTRFRYGGSVFVGVEYWINRQISLSGEQSIILSYYKNSNASTLSIGNSTSSLGLSVYF